MAQCPAPTCASYGWPYQTINRPTERPDGDGDDDDDVTFGGLDEFKLIAGGHEEAAGPNEERNHFGTSIANQSP